jgi:prepilin-type N-terminal cleavage/methylation domain-containing protein
VSARSDEGGFTLVELLIATAILGVIALPLSMAVIGGVRSLGLSSQKFNDSRSALVSASYFAGDVAGANAVVVGDASACGGGTAVVSFDSSSATAGVSAPTNTEVSYVMNTTDTTNTTLVRKSCASGGTATSSTAAVQLGSTPVVTCYDASNVVDSTCANPQWVKMLVTQKLNTASAANPTPVAYTFTLEGTVRTQ